MLTNLKAELFIGTKSGTPERVSITILELLLIAEEATVLPSSDNAWLVFVIIVGSLVNKLKNPFKDLSIKPMATPIEEREIAVYVENPIFNKQIVPITPQI